MIYSNEPTGFLNRQEIILSLLCKHSDSIDILKKFKFSVYAAKKCF